MARWYDVAFTNERNHAGLFPFTRYVQHLAHAYDPAVHTPDGPSAPPCDVFFCGTRYPERAALLDGVDWTGIDVCDRTLRVDADTPFEQAARQILTNDVVAMHYRSARISLNQHRTTQSVLDGGTIAPDSAWSLNPRAFEIPACGGFCVSDARADLPLLFGDSVPTYHDSESLERVIRYYLAHEDERRALADRQRAAVLPHSWAARARQVLDTLTAISATPRIAA